MVLRRRRFGVRWLDTALDRRATIPVFLTQNGGGTFTRKIVIIASAMISLAEHGADVPEQTSPTRTASVDHAFARDDFTDDRANHRTNEQANQAEKQIRLASPEWRQSVPHFVAPKYFAPK